MEAEVIKGRLESEGIPAIIRREAIAGIYGLTSVGLAAAKVLVPAPLAERALALLEDSFVDDEAGASERENGAHIDVHNNIHSGARTDQEPIYGVNDHE